MKRGPGRPRKDGTPAQPARMGRPPDRIVAIRKLPPQFHISPETAEKTYERKVAAGILLGLGGRFTSGDGREWNIKAKNLGAGIMRVYLEKIDKKATAVVVAALGMPTFEADMLEITEAVRG